MEITFLGGGHEIGASCALVDIGAHRVLVDCGVRMTGDAVLPDFGLLATRALPAVDAVVLTHAHLDHSGALPVFHQQYPSTPVYMLPPTQALVSVLLQDALRVAQSRFESDGDLPVFPPAAVEALLARVIPVRLGEPTPLGSTSLTATWFPAGHILGAACVGLEGDDHGRTVRVLFSGDLAVGEQLTVPGMPVPTAFRQPDVLVLESTYGDRLHSPRRAEEQRLLQVVTGMRERQGKLLIPAFALGRAQEVALLLMRAIRQHHLASVPVYLDGLVRSICGVYTTFPAYQTPFCQRLAAQYGNPFVGVIDEVQMVGGPQERERIVSGPPCVIIASSGMLRGGASAAYASVLAQDARNAIALTGYQDEESPGRRLLDLAEGRGNTLAIGERTVAVHCTVTKYALSAHADADELTRLVAAINPREVVLVHGEGGARPALADRLYRSATQRRPVHLPRTGETLQFGKRGRAPQAAPPPPAGIGAGEGLDATTLPRLIDHLRTHPRAHPYSPAELLDRWYGPQRWGETQFAACVALLATGAPGLRTPPQHPHLYQVVSAPATPGGQGPATAQGPTRVRPPRHPQAQMEAWVAEILGTPPDLYHVGFHLGLRQIRLRFAFPAVAAHQYRDQLARLQEATGWTIQLNQTPHQERLVAEACALVPAGVTLERPPAVHEKLQTVTLTLAPGPPPEVVTALTATFRARTGWTLACQDAAPAAPPAVPPAAGATLLEINAAFRALDAAFADVPALARPSRKSLKVTPTGPVIELTFMTPQIGQQHALLLAHLHATTGYPLTVKPTANQDALRTYLQTVLPPRWGIQGAPSLREAQQEVRVACTHPPRPGMGEAVAVAAQVRREIGWTLVVGRTGASTATP